MCSCVLLLPESLHVQMHYEAFPMRLARNASDLDGIKDAAGGRRRTGHCKSLWALGLDSDRFNPRANLIIWAGPFWCYLCVAIL